MIAPARNRLFYRCVHNNPPNEADFWSNSAIGVEMRPPYTADRLRIWEGISVYDSLDRAEWRAARMNPPRRWVAILQIPLDGRVTFQKTMADPAHFTLWGTAEALRDCVVSVQEVHS